MVDRRRRTGLAVLALLVVGTACSAVPETVPVGVSADGGDVRFPVDAIGDDPYVDPDASGTPDPGRPRARRRTVGGGIDIVDRVYPGRPKPATPSICGARHVIATGRRVQFPWAPPCVKHELAEGSSARGVTTTTIRVAYYVTGDPKIQTVARNSGGCGTAECTERYARAYAAWFNRYFELYGRQVSIEPFAGAASESDPRLAEADADELADRGVFAVLGGPQEAGARFAARLASRGVLCICTISLPEEFYGEHSPYVWSWLMSSTQAYIHRADYVAKRLAGRPARWAGSAALRARERSFALVWFDNTDRDYARGVEFFAERLAASGVRLAESVRYENIQGCQTAAASMVERLQAADVTSVIFAGDPICPAQLSSAAQARGATWEWIIAGSVMSDQNEFARLYDQTQWKRAFGISMRRPAVRTNADYWARMLTEVDPTIEPMMDAMTVLEPLSLFFTGVHMAGPDLTAWTFRRGMRALPDSGGSVTLPRRSYGPRVVEGIVLSDHTSYDDMTEIWYDPVSTDPNGQVGSYRYVARGKRFAWDAWPATAPDVFNRATSIVGYIRPPDQPAPSQ